ncbi:hypothetical protein WJX73_003433 [Symbiochloris irregularis]|uniref:Uncharacterized protein n=1 Tax=Symbiochloris irregularis TaxID=706552 RepID=A0AAW1PJA4_9CHLO
MPCLAAFGLPSVGPQRLHSYRPTQTLLLHQKTALHVRQRRNFCRAEVNYATGAPPTPKAPPAGQVQEIRKTLLQIGWQRAWIDGISDRLIKREFDTTAERCKDVVTYLTDEIGIPSNNVCNMASRAARILGQDVEQQIKPVVDYINGRGVSGHALGLLLAAHPKLLLCTVASDGAVLHLGNSRAQAIFAVREDCISHQLAKPGMVDKPTCT